MNFGDWGVEVSIVVFTVWENDAIGCFIRGLVFALVLAIEGWEISRWWKGATTEEKKNQEGYRLRRMGTKGMIEGQMTCGLR